MSIRKAARRRLVQGFFILVFLICAAAQARAEDLTFEAPSGDQFRKAIAALPADEQKAIEAVARETFPVFVFIPGIMGSKLTKTLPGGEKVIWGHFQGAFARPDHNLAYSTNDKVKAEVLEEYYAYKQPFDIYGKAIHTLRHINLASSDNVQLFAYDWRQSNVQSAKDLSVWLCGNRDKLKGRPVVFMAHSMGGLVLKHWLKNIYETGGCGAEEAKFSGWLSVKKVIFLGTPHYGAPKSVSAFGDRHYLLLDPHTLAGKIFGGIDANTMSASVNMFGATFPSAYELLPVLNASGCLKDPNWEYPVEVKLATGGVNRNVNLFSADVWKLFHWPRQLSDQINRDEFVAKELPRLLKSAEQFLCDLAGFDIEKKFDVTRVYGNQRDTICKVIVHQADNKETPPKISFEMCTDKGDGTVPAWVASELTRYSIDKSQAASHSHADLLGSGEFIYYLNQYARQLHRQMQASFERRQGTVEPVAKMYAAVRYIVPSASTADAANETTAKVARRSAEILGLNTRSLFAQAMANRDPLQRAEAYRLIADVAKPDDILGPWALNNAAHIYWEQKDFSIAADISDRAISAPGSAVQVKAVLEARGRAALTGALAARELGQIEKAKGFRETAIAYGNSRAMHLGLGD